jgi:hypothetical protein
LSWVATSHIFATGITEENTMESQGYSSVSAPSQAPYYRNSQIQSRPRNEISPENSIYSQPLKFADDHYDGISSCPAAIICQLSLLCLERAREIEHDILVDLENLFFNRNENCSGVEAIFFAYISLALMMDAYEKYLTQFEELEEQFRRCLHLVECLTSELGHFLRGSTMGHFLEEVGQNREEKPLDKSATKMRKEFLDDDNRTYFDIQGLS